MNTQLTHFAVQSNLMQRHADDQEYRFRDRRHPNLICVSRFNSNMMDSSLTSLKQSRGKMLNV